MAGRDRFGGKIPVTLGTDPFGNPVIGFGEIRDDKLIVTVEEKTLFLEANQIPHTQGNSLESTEQIIGLALNVAYKVERRC